MRNCMMRADIANLGAAVTRTDHFVHAPSQWETTLHGNAVSHWLDAYTKPSRDTDLSTMDKYMYTCGCWCTLSRMLLCTNEKLNVFSIWYVYTPFVCQSVTSYRVLSIYRGQFSLNNSRKTTHGSPVRASSAVSFLSVKFDRSFATVII